MEVDESQSVEPDQEINEADGYEGPEDKRLSSRLGSDLNVLMSPSPLRSGPNDGDSVVLNALLNDGGAAAIESAKAVGGLAARGFGRLTGFARDAVSALPDAPGLSAAADLARGAAGTAADLVGGAAGNAVDLVGGFAGAAADLVGTLPGVALTMGEGVAGAASAIDLGAVADAASGVAGAALEGAAGIVGDILNA